LAKRRKNVPYALPLAQLFATICIFFVVRKASARTLESFLVADRSVSHSTGTISVTANWLQAPAILASGALAYTSPWHFTYFIVPNVLALMLPGVLAPYIQRAMPRGYTLPQFIELTYGPAVRTLLFVSSTFALIGAVGYTFIGLKSWFANEFNMPVLEMVLLLSVFAAAWSLPQGLRGALIGDQVKVFAIVLLLLGVCFLWVIPHEHAHSIHPSILTPKPLEVFFMTGLPLAISLMGGPLCNPDLAERIYALDSRSVRRSYIKAALLFGGGALLFGSLGLLARHYGVDASKAPPAFVVLKAFAPAFTPIAGGILIVILTAALASLIASAGDLFSIELIHRFRPTTAENLMIGWSRFFMLVPLGIGIMIATQGWSIDYVLKGMGAVRGEAIFPVVAAVFLPRTFRGTAMFAGMLFGLVFGLASIFSGIAGAWGPALGACIAFLSPIVFACLDHLFKRG